MSARSGEQKPVRMQRRMKAKICLSLALENPHQALDAYMSFATATTRKISCSESSNNPCLRRTRSAYRVCAQAAMTLCTCNVTDRLLVNVTPRILIVCTRWSSGILSGIENFVFRLCYESDKHRLNVTGFSGDADDALSRTSKAWTCQDSAETSRRHWRCSESDSYRLNLSGLSVDIDDAWVGQVSSEHV